MLPDRIRTVGRSFGILAGLQTALAAVYWDCNLLRQGRCARRSRQSCSQLYYSPTRRSDYKTTARVPTTRNLPKL
eukprot:3680126-Pyramimonas_sp.AAC.1